MARIIKLSVLGLILLAGLLLFVRSRGSIPGALGLELEIITDLSSPPECRRQIRIFGPPDLQKIIAKEIGIYDPNDPNQIYGYTEKGRPYLNHTLTGTMDDLPNWPWSKTTIRQSKWGLFKKYHYKEQFEWPILDRVSTARQNWLAQLSDEQKRSFEEEFWGMFQEVGRRLKMKLSKIIASIPIRLLIYMPEEVARTRGPGIISADGKTVLFTVSMDSMQSSLPVSVSTMQFNIIFCTIAALILIGIGCLLTMYYVDKQKRKKLFQKYNNQDDLESI